MSTTQSAAQRAVHRRMAQVALPATPEGQTYSARVVGVEAVTPAGGEFGFLMFLEVRTPHAYRGKLLAHAIRLDPDRPATFKAAVLELHRCGLSTQEIVRGDVPTVLTGRTLRFRFTPETAEGREDYRIEIVSCAWAGGHPKGRAKEAGVGKEK